MDFSRRNILSLQPRFCLGLSLWPLRAQDKAGSGLGQFQRWPLRANSDVATKGLSMWPLRAQDKAGRGLGQIQLSMWPRRAQFNVADHLTWPLRAQFNVANYLMWPLRAQFNVANYLMWPLRAQFNVVVATKSSRQSRKRARTNSEVDEGTKQGWRCMHTQKDCRAFIQVSGRLFVYRSRTTQAYKIHTGT